MLLNDSCVESCSSHMLTSFTVATLVAGRAGTCAWCGTVTAVHALWIAERRLAVLSHVTLRALADLVLVAYALVGALLVTLRIWAFGIGLHGRAAPLDKRGFFWWRRFADLFGFQVFNQDEHTCWRVYVFVCDRYRCGCRL